jgi:uncharacterized delta-60 repeat protein
MRNYTFLFGLVLVICTSVFGDGPPAQWVARYNGPENGDEYASALTVDKSGNVYVTGYSYYSGTGNDYATVKYGPDGNPLWAKCYNGQGNSDDMASALAVDNSGNVYVTGESYGSDANSSYATIKYSPDGNQLWAKYYNGPANSYNGASALAVDSSGNVYVTGYSYDSDAISDYATVKYGPDGSQLWAERYNGPDNGDDYACALTIDSSGNVYVTGNSYSNDTSTDYATVKYGPNGNPLWAKCYNGQGNGDDIASALAVDNSGNVFVTGYSVGSGTGTDYATIKYSPDGNQLWAARYNGPGNDSDFANALALDISGNVYVTGSSNNSSTSFDYATVKYGPNGNQLWVARYNGPANDYDSASALAVDSSGNVYVTGYSYDSNTGTDYATVKYSPDGNQLWMARYNGPANSDDGASALAVDNSGNVYVTGNSQGNDTSSDYATIKYIQRGYCINPVAGDLNNDCKVDFEDVAVLASHWLECNYALQEDCQ